MIWSFLWGGIRAIIAWLTGPKATPKEKDLTHDLQEAKRAEVALVAPPRDKPDVLERMRERAGRD